MIAAASLQHDLISPFAGADVCRQAWHCLTRLAAPPSSTTCGTSPTSSGCRSICPWRTGASISPRSPTRTGAWSPRSSCWPCSPRAIQLSRHCRGPIARPFTCAAASDGWKRPSGSSAGSAGAGSATWHRSARRTARHTWLSGATSPTRTAPSSASRALRCGARPPRSSSIWSTTGSCHRHQGPGRRAPVGRGVRLGGGRDAVGRTQNKTEPVAGEVLQPMLAAALHLVTVLGPHAVELDRQVRQADRVSSVKAEGLRHGAAAVVEDVRKLLERDYLATGTALPMLEDHRVARESPQDGPPATRSSRWPPGSWPGRPATASSGPASCRRCEAHCRTPSRQQGCRRPSPGTRPRPRPRTAAAHCRGPCRCTVPRPSPWSGSSAPQRSSSWPRPQA